MKRYDQAVAVDNDHIRRVNGETRIYTVEYESVGYIKLFNVNGVIFSSNGNVAQLTAMDRFPVDSEEELHANSVIRTNINWENKPRLYFACALSNKQAYIEEK